MSLSSPLWHLFDTSGVELHRERRSRVEDPGGIQLGVYIGQGLRRGVLVWGFNCNHLVGTLLQNPKMGEPKTLFANRRGVGLRARGFGPIPLASKQASKREREREREGLGSKV